MKTSAAIVVLLAVAASAYNVHPREKYEVLFHAWHTQYEKAYTPFEYVHRLNIFADNVDTIEAHNSGDHSYSLGMGGPFMDLTREEFAARYLGFRGNAVEATTTAESELMVELPTSVDWRQKGAVTPVKNQGQCGSCWAFSTTGSTEGVTEIATGTLTSLSEQQLVDCSGSYGNQGCNGGLMDNAFKYIIANGICTEASYPYTAQDGTCKASSCTKGATLSSYQDITKNNQQAMMTAAARQPVSIAVEADQSGWQFYSGGVFDGTCGTKLDHGVLVVGYGTQGSSPYYIVKNSWGSSWGEQGYILLGNHASGSGQCGMYMAGSTPTH
eukprot:PLAT9194.3.p2 GENE.PLAT9194.3~~PLAT9194.3.p2  ORF type:complete len:336 (-),score=94.22 PLAT9194.3:148-1128(-)